MSLGAHVQELVKYLPSEVTQITVHVLWQFWGQRHSTPQRAMLWQAMQMRALILIIDGIDESAHLRDHLRYLLVDVLAPLGLTLIATSRPEGVALEHYKGQSSLYTLGIVCCHMGIQALT